MPDCPACGTVMNDEVERTTRRLLATLDDARATKLTEAYRGERPEVLCAPCFLPTVSMLNGVRS